MPQALVLSLGFREAVVCLMREFRKTVNQMSGSDRRDQGIRLMLLMYMERVPPPPGPSKPTKYA